VGSHCFFPLARNTSIVREIGGFANNTTSRGQHLGVPCLLRNNSQQTKIECTRTRAQEREREREREREIPESRRECRIAVEMKNIRFEILSYLFFELIVDTCLKPHRGLANALDHNAALSSRGIRLSLLWGSSSGVDSSAGGGSWRCYPRIKVNAAAAWQSAAATTVAADCRPPQRR